jgi:plasmid stability protein
MKNVQVRNVPERVHKVLRRRATAAGQSLQEYLLKLLEESTARPTMKEWLEQVERHVRGSKAKIPPGEVARIIREEREKREQDLYRRIRPDQ